MIRSFRKVNVKVFLGDSMRQPKYPQGTALWEGQYVQMLTINPMGTDTIP